ncbi:MAG: HAD-IC family P-type ATPase, partial [Thermodesulfobacterium sp.]|nr:HAD-IC family P-type ATPase [Thermodesulfobacterium sp.]
MISVVHRLKGRVRLKGKPLYRNKLLCLYLEENLSDLPSIKSVSANPLTGSLLVYFDEVLSVEELTSKVEFLILNFKPIENSPKDCPKKASETQNKPWHLMSASQVLDYFQVDPRAGLDERSAEAKLNEYGPNQIPDVEPRSRWEVFLSQFKSLPIILLSLSSLFSIATGGLVDGIAILVAVFINSIIGYMTEYQSERLIFSLKSLVKPMARVLREGKEKIIGAEEVVPGDILILKPGQYVPADARVVESHQLTVDESALTGESLPVVKTSDVLSVEPGIEVPLADRVNMVYAGTFVTSGYGLAVVVATGVHTELGKIQLSLREGDREKAPFEVQLEEISRKFIIISGGFCGLVFALGLLRGYGFFRVMKL